MSGFRSGLDLNGVLAISLAVFVSIWFCSKKRNQDKAQENEKQNENEKHCLGPALGPLRSSARCVGGRRVPRQSFVTAAMQQAQRSDLPGAVDKGRFLVPFAPMLVGPLR